MILVIGGGSIGKRHIQNLHEIGEHHIYCLKREVDEQFERELNVKVITSYNEASKYNFDTVLICTPTALHNEGLKFAVGQNASIFIEKPLIHSQEYLNESQSILANYPKVFFIGFMLRFHPLVCKIKEIIDDGSLGSVHSARLEFGSFLPYWHPWEDYKTSYASRKELGGGVINTITHELDLIQYFFGDPKTVYCEAYNFNTLKIEVEEQCEALFSYSNKSVSLHLDYLQKDYDRNIKILFDEGKVIWNWHDNKLVVLKHKEKKQEFVLTDYNVNQLYIDELKAFFELLKIQSLHHDLDQKHAFNNTRLMLAMHESASCKKRISL